MREITDVITARPDCVSVEVVYYSGGYLDDSDEWSPAHVSLVPHHGQADPARNPTPWWFIEWTTYMVEPTTPCA